VNALVASAEKSRPEQEAELSRLSVKEQSLKAETEAMNQAEQDLLRRIVEAESHLVEQAKTRQLAEAQAKQRAENEQRLNEEIESLRRAEQVQLERIQEIKTSISGLEEARRLALEEAELLAEQEQQLIVAVGALREQEAEHVKRVDGVQEQLAAQVKAVIWLKLKRDSMLRRSSKSTANWKTPGRTATTDPGSSRRPHFVCAPMKKRETAPR
jgi:chromosome segregation ATPase